MHQLGEAVEGDACLGPTPGGGGTTRGVRAGEHVVAVGSLPHGDGAGPAVELFLERARAANPAFEFGPGHRAVVADICEQLDGMPLPIELAAARVSVLTPAEILDRMGDRFRLLSGGRGRHRRRTT